MGSGFGSLQRVGSGIAALGSGIMALGLGSVPFFIEPGIRLMAECDND